MSGARVFLVALAVVFLACVSVRASSVDAWAAPSSEESWPSLEEFASDAELAQVEYQSLVSGSSSSGAATPTLFINSSLTFSANFTADNVPAGYVATMKGLLCNMTGGIYPCENILVSICQAAAVPGATCVGNPNTVGDIFSSGTGRRLLADGELKTIVEVLFVVKDTSDSLASIVSTGIAAQIACRDNSTCVAAAANGLAANLTTYANYPIYTVSLTTLVSNLVAADPSFAALLTQDLQLLKFNDGKVDDNQKTGFTLGAPTAATSGTANKTNAGYYVLAAVLALSIVIAGVYMIMHKADVHEDKYAGQHNGAELAPVPTAAPASGPVAVTNPEDAPLGGQSHMDYKSVFALHNNVLEEHKAAPAEDNSNQNDVHFILHQ